MAPHVVRMPSLLGQENRLLAQLRHNALTDPAFIAKAEELAQVLCIPTGYRSVFTDFVADVYSVGFSEGIAEGASKAQAIVNALVQG